MTTSIRDPTISPPVSAAKASPYPGMYSFVPNGITLGSTATTPCFACIPEAVIPSPPPSVGRYAVASIVSTCLTCP